MSSSKHNHRLTCLTSPHRQRYPPLTPEPILTRHFARTSWRHHEKRSNYAATSFNNSYPTAKRTRPSSAETDAAPNDVLDLPRSKMDIHDLNRCIRRHVVPAKPGSQTAAPAPEENTSPNARPPSVTHRSTREDVVVGEKPPRHNHVSSLAPNQS